MMNILYSQIDALRCRGNTKGHKTKARYYEAAWHFGASAAENLGLQKFKNLNATHFRAFAEHLKAKKKALHRENRALRSAALSPTPRQHKPIAGNQKACV